MIVALSVSGSLYPSAQWQTGAEAVLSGAALSTLYRQRKLWSCADPGPSAHTLPSEDKKRRLHYQLQTTPPPLQSASSQALILPPFLLPSLPLCFPSTIPASSKLYCPSQERGGADCQRKPPIPPPASAVQCTDRERQREMRKEMEKHREMAYSIWFESTNYLFVFLH